MDVVCKPFVLLCFLFLGAGFIPYVLVTILNLPHPHLRNIIGLFDTQRTTSNKCRSRINTSPNN